jgi:hypothetical protein
MLFNYQGSKNAQTPTEQASRMSDRETILKPLSHSIPGDSLDLQHLIGASPHPYTRIQNFQEDF